MDAHSSCAWRLRSPRYDALIVSKDYASLIFVAAFCFLCCADYSNYERTNLWDLNCKWRLSVPWSPIWSGRALGTASSANAVDRPSELQLVWEHCVCFISRW